MNNNQYFIYLLIIALSTYLIRVIPFVLFHKKIKNKFVNDILYYIPYTVLTAMTFPAALYVTDHFIFALVGLLSAILIALRIKNLTLVALTACISVILCELLMLMI